MNSAETPRVWNRSTVAVFALCLLIKYTARCKANISDHYHTFAFLLIISQTGTSVCTNES